MISTHHSIDPLLYLLTILAVYPLPILFQSRSKTHAHTHTHMHTHTYAHTYTHTHTQTHTHTHQHTHTHTNTHSHTHTLTHTYTHTHTHTYRWPWPTTLSTHHSIYVPYYLRMLVESPLYLSTILCIYHIIYVCSLHHHMNHRSLLQKGPTKETIFCKRDDIYSPFYLYVCSLHHHMSAAVIHHCITTWITGLFCKRALQKRRYSAKETYNFKEPTNKSLPIKAYQ